MVSHSEQREEISHRPAASHLEHDSPLSSVPMLQTPHPSAKAAVSLPDRQPPRVQACVRGTVIVLTDGPRVPSGERTAGRDERSGKSFL